MASPELDPRGNNTRDGGGHCTRVASVWPHQREPRTFSGKADEDVEEWLKHYQRVSKYNRWDQVMQLDNVVFYLAGTALLWFENHEEALATWEQFVDEIKQCFGDSISKKKKAEQTLAQRAQIPGETCTTYIEEVLKLCTIVCPQMSDEDKVGHLLKGIAEDVYNFLITKEDLASAADVVRHCRAFETLNRRITPKFGRLANVTTVASVDISATEDIAAVFRRIVREELDQQFQKVSHEPRPRLYADPVPVNYQCALQHAPATESAASWIRQLVRDHCSEYHADVRTAAPFQPLLGAVNLGTTRCPVRRAVATTDLGALSPPARERTALQPKPLLATTAVCGATSPDFARDVSSEDLDYLHGLRRGGGTPCPISLLSRFSSQCSRLRPATARQHRTAACLPSLRVKLAPHHRVGALVPHRWETSWCDQQG